MGAALSSPSRQQVQTTASATRRGCEAQAEDWPFVWAVLDGSVLDWKKGLSSDEIQQIAKEQQDLPCQISDHLYLGNARCVQNLSKLKELKIAYVLNMAGPLALPSKTVKAMKQKGIIYKRINAQDEEDYPLLENHLDEACDFLKQCRGQNCIVHCVAGHNRSSLIVSAYYMLEHRTHVLETVKHIRRQRGNVALQNEYFQEQLVSFAREHELLGPPPGTPGSLVKTIPPKDWRPERKQANDKPLGRLSLGWYDSQHEQPIRDPINVNASQTGTVGRILSPS
jgi:protein-tyrosine phosphatase